MNNLRNNTNFSQGQHYEIQEDVQTIVNEETWRINTRYMSFYQKLPDLYLRSLSISQQEIGTGQYKMNKIYKL